MKRFLMVAGAFCVAAMFSAPTSWAQADDEMIVVIKENEEREGAEKAEEQAAVEALKQALMNKVASATATAESKKVKVTYLGVVTSPTTEVLTAQLKLPKDTALIVEQVAAKSPAETAGLKPNDVLVKLDEQILVNIAQLRVLVRMRKPGEVVRLTYIREGVQAVAVATLSEEWEPISVDLLEGIQRPGWTANNAVRLELEREARAAALTNPFSGAAVTQVDNGVHSVTIQQEGRSKRARVVEKATGKVVFDGPIDTPEQRKALPPEIAKLLENVRISPYYGGSEMKAAPVAPPGAPVPAPAPAPEKK